MSPTKSVLRSVVIISSLGWTALVRNPPAQAQPQAPPRPDFERPLTELSSTHALPAGFPRILTLPPGAGNRVLAEPRVPERERLDTPRRHRDLTFESGGAFPSLWPHQSLAASLPDRRTVTCTVNSTGDSGPGTLRDCLRRAGPDDEIRFDPSVFPPTNPQPILPASALPEITVDGLTLDASQAGVILDGSNVPSPSVGLVAPGVRGVTIRGLHIRDFQAGIALAAGAVDCTIGGDRSIGTGPFGQANRFTANVVGVQLQDHGTSGNSILGNVIGIGVRGDTAAGNAIGVAVARGASGNVIGGERSGVACDGPCNLISGNETGVLLENADTQGNSIVGNFIGTNLPGDAAVANDAGVVVDTGASRNLIGGQRSGPACDGPCNLISGNLVGVQLQDKGTSGNVIAGNSLGTDPAGGKPIGNDIGIGVIFGASGNVIGGERDGPACSGPCNVVGGNNTGIQLQEAATSGNLVAGNYVGIDATGSTSIGNKLGIVVTRGSSGNVIGGERAGAACDGPCNLVSGNGHTGIGLYEAGTSDNKVVGNFIGTNVDGTAARANRYGIVISGGASGNAVGGERPGIACDGACNLVSGNRIGIAVEEDRTEGNTVVGNYVGTDITGRLAIANERGIGIGYGASGNVVGGERAGAICDGPCNLISGNEDGVGIQDTGTVGNTVVGNYVGPDCTGGAVIGNTLGVVVLNGASKNVVGGDRLGTACDGPCNLIGGNSRGVSLSGAGTAENAVVGNFVGTGPTGSAALANEVGIQIQDSASGSVIGRARAPERCDGGCNLISGNALAGISEDSGDASQIVGNFIGTDVNGSRPLPNRRGVEIGAAAANAHLGGSGAGEGNIISGNTQTGIVLGSRQGGNRLTGNIIGMDVSGAVPVPNNAGIQIEGPDNYIGGDRPGEGNLISGNRASGLLLLSSRNSVAGNKIGTDASGTRAMPNATGIVLAASSENVIGGTAVGSGNLVSGNTYSGVQIEQGSVANTVVGNFIGTDLAGESALGNGVTGVAILAGSSDNTVGGSVTGSGNLISGNGSVGIQIQGAASRANRIRGNKIGTNVTGLKAVPNGRAGVGAIRAAGTIIGGPHSPGKCEGPCNLISGNDGPGLVLSGRFSGNAAEATLAAIVPSQPDTSEYPGSDPGSRAGNERDMAALVLGNFIGTDLTGMAALPNTDAGLILQYDSTGNTVGGTDPGAGNLISGNQEMGVWILDAGGNDLLGNLVGVAADGRSPLPNGSDGVRLAEANDSAIGPGNVVAYNGSCGVLIADPRSVRNTITRSGIFRNVSGQICWSDSVPIPPVQAPVLAHWDGSAASGTSCANCRLEIFVNQFPGPGGQVFIDAAMADMDGSFAIAVALASLPASYRFLSATATEPDGTTSSFARPLVVREYDAVYLPLGLNNASPAIPQPTSTPTATPGPTGTPIPWPTATPGLGGETLRAEG